MNVTLRKKQYPVVVEGNGKLPCLCIGTATLIQRTLSTRSKETFTYYFTDLYWNQEGADGTITLEMIVDDIAEIAKQLGLTQFILMGHSAYGIVALEFAKKYPEMSLGVIMIGTPINSNSAVAAKNNQTFEKMADPKRKEIDKTLRDAFSKKDLSPLSKAEQFLEQYITQDAPRYWHDPNYDCRWMWEGMILNDYIIQFFETVLPNHDVQKGLENVQAPIFLAAGMSDFDCCPWDWEDVPNKPKNLHVARFEKSGHYPHFEEAEAYDSAIQKWLRHIK